MSFGQEERGIEMGKLMQLFLAGVGTKAAGESKF